MKRASLTIGRVAKQANVNIETIRHYQRLGLITEPEKPLSGFRYYPLDTVEKVLFIKRAQQIGFTLKEIGELLILESAHCDDVRSLAESKKAKINQQIQDLLSIRSVLDDMISGCKANTDKVHCTMINALSPSKSDNN
jgi:MerR family mercuric resistance operon transcriptional regulator